MPFKVLGGAGGGASGITEAEADARYLRLAGGTMTGALVCDASAHIRQMRDGFGVNLSGGAMFYKPAGGGVGIRESSGNQQPFIENNDGTNRRDIIDSSTIAQDPTIAALEARIAALENP